MDLDRRNKMPFYEDYQMLYNHESYDLYHSNPSYRDVINYVYKQTAPSLFSDKDPMRVGLKMHLMRNNHILNVDENNDVKYMVGFYADPLRPTIVISSLYVHPNYRRNGIASKLLKHFQEDVCGDNMIIVAAVEPYKNDVINMFHSLGFISPLPVNGKDDLGAQYLDMFWSRQKFKVWYVDQMLHAQFID